MVSKIVQNYPELPHKKMRKKIAPTLPKIVIKNTQNVDKKYTNYQNGQKLPKFTKHYKRPKMVKNNAKNGPTCVLTLTFCPNKIPSHLTSDLCITMFQN